AVKFISAGRGHLYVFFFQAEDGIRYSSVTGVQTCALPISKRRRSIPYWAVHRFGIERRRFAVIQTVAARAARLETTANLEPAEARLRLTSLPGIGQWSAAEVSVVAYGDRDAVSLGDYHLPHQVAWALAGEPRATDDRM